jgi:hypothetical protein
MSSSATPLVAKVLPDDRLAALFEEMSELTGQRNAIDGRLATSSPKSTTTASGAPPAPDRSPPWWPGRPECHRATPKPLPHADAATFDAALASHTDALIAQWRRDHPDNSEGGDREGQGDGEGSDVRVPPFPTRVDGFISLIESGWDADVAARPHAQRTTVVVHLNLEDRTATFHLGPFLSDADRRQLLCDADCEIWFQRHGQPIGSARATRQISRRLRRALEHRDHCCVVPGCGTTRGLHAHHIQHWEDGGATELVNLVLVCPYHHRLHHLGGITITGDAHHLVVTDRTGRQLTPGSLARPPTTPPPAVAPYPGPTGERADWWWYDPYQPPPPTKS